MHTGGETVMARLERVVHGLSVTFQAVRRALRFLLGRWSWEPPTWLAAIGRGLAGGGRWMRAHRARSLAVAVALLLVVGGGGLLGRWYMHRPRPAMVKVMVTPPGPTPVPVDD